MLKKVICLLVIVLGVSTASKLELRANTQSTDAYWIESENLLENAESIGRMMVYEIAVKAKEGTNVDSQGDVVAQKFVDIAQSFPETNINTKKWNIIIVDTNNSIIGKSRRSNTLAHFSYDSNIYYVTANQLSCNQTYLKPNKWVLNNLSNRMRDIIAKADYEWYDSELGPSESFAILDAVVRAQENSNGDKNSVAFSLNQYLVQNLDAFVWDVIVLQTINQIKGQSSKGCKFAYLRYAADVYYIVGH